jgi:hypothetical protein
MLPWTEDAIINASVVEAPGDTFKTAQKSSLKNYPERRYDC